MWETAFAAFGQGLGQSAGAPFVGGSSSANSGGTLNTSGWVVNLNGTQIGATASPTMTSAPTADPAAASFYAPPAVQAGGASVTVLAAVALGAAVLFALRRKRGK